MTASTPAEAVELLAERISARDVEGALALYEPAAAFRAQPGEVVTARGEHRNEKSR